MNGGEKFHYLAGLISMCIGVLFGLWWTGHDAVMVMVLGLGIGMTGGALAVWTIEDRWRGWIERWWLAR